jgi:hypothetical protein
MQPENIKVVLVEPSHPGNIGAVARAMKNMGLTRLCWWRRSSFPDPQATWRAVSAADVLQAAEVVGQRRRGDRRGRFRGRRQCPRATHPLAGARRAARLW